jgi:mRNA-degrading endonuclease RelE of RelBE toxin-antitoxin system
MVDLGHIPVRTRARLWKAIQLLKIDPFPNGIYGGVEVESGSVQVYSREVPPINKLKVKNPPTVHRVLYMIDDLHSTVLAISVRHRDVAYEATTMHLAMLHSIVKEYFENRGWENAR